MTQMIISGLIVGTLLGFILQRGKVCFTGAFRDMYIAKDNRLFTTLLIAIFVQSVGIFVLMQLGVMEGASGTFSLFPIIAGSLIFGFGSILTGGCATGVWFRSGEGNIGSFISLGGFMLMAAMMRTGVLAELNTSIQGMGPQMTNSITESLGVPMLVPIAVLAVVTGYFIYKEIKKPKFTIPTLKPKRKGLAHLLFEKRWNTLFAAVLIGIMALVAWPASIATGRNFGLGITTPSANILQYLVLGEESFLNWGVFLVLGILLGSFLAAKASREFRVRVPSAAHTLRHFAGGLVMGFGATIGAGCTIGNGLVQTALMTWQGWISLVFMILGTWIAAHVFIVRPQQATTSAPSRGALAN